MKPANHLELASIVCCSLVTGIAIFLLLHVIAKQEEQAVLQLEIQKVVLDSSLIVIENQKILKKFEIAVGEDRKERKVDILKMKNGLTVRDD